MLRYIFIMFTIPVFLGTITMRPTDAAEPLDQSTGFDIQQTLYGKTREGLPVTLYTLSHGDMRLSVIDYGATLTSLVVPDRDGKLDDVVLGSESFENYLKGGYGAVIGRFANRIGNARFTLDGEEVRVTQNAGPHHIHGGRNGFARVVWKGKILAQQPGQVGVQFSYFSKDGEEGYPGNLDCRVTYVLTKAHELKIEYYATTDKPTVINLTNHAYFNLAGAGQGKVYDHVLHVDADAYTVSDEALIPTGEIRSVKGTPLDFGKPIAIGSRIEQLQQPRGYDHNYVFNRWDGTLKQRATVHDPHSGRVMEMLTTEPGMQLYTANHFRNVPGRGGSSYQQHDAFCLETQHFPDSPNKPNFPSTVLRPGETFNSVTVFRFSTL